MAAPPFRTSWPWMSSASVAEVDRAPMAATPFRRRPDFALVAPGGRIGVRLPDWDLFAAAYELPGSEPLFEGNERVGHWVVLPGGASAKTPRRCAIGSATPTT